MTNKLWKLVNTVGTGQDQTTDGILKLGTREKINKGTFYLQRWEMGSGKLTGDTETFFFFLLF